MMNARLRTECLSLLRGLSLCLSLLLAACAVPVEVDYDTGRDFSRLKNYAWLPMTAEQQRQDPVIYNTLTDKRMRQSVDRLLAAKGFRRVEFASADFLVTYHLKVEQKLESEPFSYGVGYGWGHSGMVMGGGRDIYQYEEERVLVDMLDPRSRELLWRGGVSEETDRYASPREREGRILRQMHEVLASFPPR